MARVYNNTPVEMLVAEAKQYLEQMACIRKLFWGIMRHLMTICVTLTSMHAAAQVDASECQLAVSLHHVKNVIRYLTESQCRQLAKRFGTGMHGPGSGQDFVVWDQKQQEVRSACRVEPYTSDDVAFVLKTIVENSCRFAVKSGGHARNADDSVSVGGVTIDLARLKSTEVAADQQSVRLGAGHVLYTLYSGLEQYNLSTTGGRVADVGLGGFALGGGLSNFSPKYGLAVDNVYEYEACRIRKVDSSC